MEDFDSFIYLKENEIPKKRSIKKILIFLLVSVFIGLAIALFLRYFLFTPATVSNVSMMPTFKENDVIMLSRLPKTTGEKLERGDIVAFEAPSKLYFEKNEINKSFPAASYSIANHSILYYLLDVGKITYIKRVVGLPGDHIEIEKGTVYINDKPEKDYYSVPNYNTSAGTFNEIVIPNDYLYLLGDNRPESLDSRSFGCIPISKIEGKYLFKLKKSK